LHAGSAYYAANYYKVQEDLDPAGGEAEGTDGEATLFISQIRFYQSTLKAFSTLGIVFQMFFREGLCRRRTPLLFQHVPVGVDVRLFSLGFIVVVYVEGAGLANKLSVVIVHDIIL
jgi:hypothetical protein